MLDINTITKGAVNQNSILSINVTNPESIKNQKNIQSVNFLKNPSTPVLQHINTKQAELYHRIKKGQKIPILSHNVIEACFGWSTTDNRCDVDVSAFLLGENDKVLGDNWFVFYGQTESPDRSVILEQAVIDHQKIKIDIKKIHSKVKKIVFVLTIHEALTQKLHFGMIKDAYIRIMEKEKEIASFMMTEYYTNVISMMIGELYLYQGKWKFNAIGDGIAQDLAGLCQWYGVEVI